MFEIEKRFSNRASERDRGDQWKAVKCVLLIAVGKWFPSEAKLNDTKRTNLEHPCSVSFYLCKKKNATLSAELL